MLLVVGDDRRSVVEVAEVEAAATLLLHVERVGQLSSGGTRSLADCIETFNVRRQLASLHRHLASDVGDNARGLVCDRLALSLVGIENLGRSSAVVEASELPGEIGSVRNAGTHTEAAERHPNVRSVAADEHAPVTELARHEPASDPILLGQDLVLDLRSDAENRAYHSVPIEVIQLCFSGIGEILQVPGLLTVDGHRYAASARIEREVEPGRLAGQQAPELRRLDVERLCVLQDRYANKLGAD